MAIIETAPQTVEPSTSTEAPQTSEATPVEAPVTTPPEEPKPDLSDRIRIKRERRALEKRAKELSARESDIESKLSKASEIEKLLKMKESEPYKLLAELGVDPLKWAEHALKPVDPRSEIEALRAEFLAKEEAREAAIQKEKAEAELARNRKADCEVLSKELTASIDYYVAISSFIESGETTVEELVNHAYQELYAHYEATQEVLKPQDIFATYEKQLEAEILRKSKLTSVYSAKKAPKAPEGITITPKAAPKDSPTTLSNRDSASRTGLSAAESKEEFKKELARKLAAANAGR